MKRAELVEVARGLRAIADVIDHDFDEDEPGDAALAALVLRGRAALCDVVGCCTA